MSEALTTSPDVAELAKALAKAQTDIKAATKDRSNPFFHSKYATLDSVWDACRIPLTSNGLCVLQGANSQGKAVTVTTMLLHSSGQWVRDQLTMDAKDASPQAIGSAITYARRYALGAMVGVVAEEDDDGNAAQQAVPAPARQRREPAAKVAVAPPVAEEPTPEQVQAEVDKAFPRYDQESEERQSLVNELVRLAEKLKLAKKDRDAYRTTYLGGADVHAADVAALAELVAALKARAGEPTK